MTKEEFDLMCLQLKVLKSIQTEYSGRSIDNVIANIESRLKYNTEKEKS